MHDRCPFVLTKPFELTHSLEREHPVALIAEGSIWISPQKRESTVRASPAFQADGTSQILRRHDFPIEDASHVTCQTRPFSDSFGGTCQIFAFMIESLDDTIIELARLDLSTGRFHPLGRIPRRMTLFIGTNFFEMENHNATVKWKFVQRSPRCVYRIHFDPFMDANPATGELQTIDFGEEVTDSPRPQIRHHSWVIWTGVVSNQQRRHSVVFYCTDRCECQTFAAINWGKSFGIDGIHCESDDFSPTLLWNHDRSRLAIPVKRRVEDYFSSTSTDLWETEVCYIQTKLSLLCLDNLVRNINSRELRKRLPKDPWLLDVEQCLRVYYQIS